MKLICCFLTALFTGFSTFAQGDLPHLLSELKKDQSDSQKVYTYKDLFVYYEYSNPDSAVYYLQDGLKLFTQQNYKPGIAKITSLLAAEDDDQGRTSVAKRRLAEALEIFNELHDTDAIATVDNQLGVIEGKEGNYNAATKFFMEALKGFEVSKNRRGMGGSYLKLGVVNEKNNNLDKALEYYNKAMELTKNTPSPNMVFLYNNIAIVYGKKEDYKKALAYLQLALEKATTPEYTGVRILSLLNIGVVYDNLGDDEKALQYFNEAIQITKDKNLPEEHARVIINMAAMISKTDPVKGIANFKEALEITEQLNLRNLRLEVYEDLVHDYKKLEKYKEALDILAQQKALQDSLFDIDKAKEIANLQTGFELDQSNAKVHELQLLGQKNLLERNKNLLQRNIIITIAIVLSIVLIVLTFFLRKITRLNEALFKRETELRKSNTVKDKLFSIIGHDLRGPVGNIPMMLQIFRDEHTTPGEQNYIYDTLMEHSQASLETLDKLLYWGQAQIKGIGLKPVDFNPVKYLQNNIQLIKSSAEQKQITIVNDVPDDISIHGDPAHFDFIIRNLLSNSVKFTYPGGTVTISISGTHAPGFTTFAITDTGIGISKEKIIDIFEPFSNSTKGTADERGTSIGLMLCKEFVIENGGNIWVESDPGKGSTFYFSFKTT